MSILTPAHFAPKSQEVSTGSRGKGPPVEPPKPGDVITVKPQFISHRSAVVDFSAGRHQIVELGLSKADQLRFRIHGLVIKRASDDPTIELSQNLIVTVCSVEIKPGKKGGTFVAVHGSAEISPFIPDFVTRVDGIPMADCRHLHEWFGPNFPSAIAADPTLLDRVPQKTSRQKRFSAEKAAAIVAACSLEVKGGAKLRDKAKRELVRKLCAVGETKSNARRLAELFDEAATPYQLFLMGLQTFLRASRFAYLIDPARAAADRPLLYVADLFVAASHTVMLTPEIEGACWVNFGCEAEKTTTALDRLIDLKIVSKIEKTVASAGGPIVGEIGERVLWSDFAFYHPGVISAVTSPGPEGGRVKATVTFDDGDVVEYDPKYLRVPSTRVMTWFGLARYVAAEKLIAAMLGNNPVVKRTASELAIIEDVLDHAAEVLRRPGFVPHEAQRRAVRQTFQYRYSIITGPPGVGKTAVGALCCAIAARLWPDDQGPVLGVAPTGRAASVMQSAAVFYQDNHPISMASSTIHKALKMAPGDDYMAFGHIAGRMVLVDESSMIDVLLMAAFLANTSAEHVVFLGDPKQLQPVGPGAPFHDMIKSGVIPSVYLTQNFRTNCLGILALCSDIAAGTISVAKLPTYLSLGGVAHIPCDYAARAQVISYLFSDLLDQGYAQTDIKVLSPHNQGATGTGRINIAIRDELGLPPDRLSVDDVLVVTQNNYHANTCPGFPQVSGEGDRDEIIFNGQLCEASNVGVDFVDATFDEDCDGIRHVRMLLNDGLDANSRLPDGVAFGRCMSVHKGQGGQFPAVIYPAERGNARFGIIQRSNVYTASSRPTRLLIIVGSFADFVDAALTADIKRHTLLGNLLVEGELTP